MKQYLTPEQTAKLIELGFEKPKSIWALSHNCPSVNQLSYESSLGLTIRVEERFIPEYAYSIGELIEMLPPIIDEYSSYVVNGGGRWSVHYSRIFERRYDVYAKELVDALYDMIIKLKDEGVI